MNDQSERKSFYMNVFALVLPMALQNLINAGVTAADVVMLGNLSEVALSGVSLANQVTFIMMLATFGLTSGASVLMAQYWGKKDRTSLEKVLAMTLAISICLGLLFEFAGVSFSRPLLRVFSNEPGVIENGAAYIRILALSYVFTCFSSAYLNILRSLEQVVISTVVYGISLVVNITLNYGLIFGHFGLPALGVTGAALATVTARMVEFGISAAHLAFFNRQIKLRLRHLFFWDRFLAHDFMVYSVPVLANELFWGSGMSTVSGIIGHIGSAMVAANSVIGVMRQLSTVVSFGLANATAIIIGKTLGAGDARMAKVYGGRLLRLTVIIGICAGLLTLAISPLIATHMAFTPEAAAHFRGMAIIAGSYFVLFQCYNATIIVGVLRGGGDTKFGMYVDIATLWCVAITFGSLAAFYWKLPVLAVYAILTCDEVIKIPLSTWGYFRYRWLRDVTR
ncbi:MAG: MATE family efflux transporter [Lachnospiraceae bacterium]|nr:MATE family efflux transporter [Lachnospiraceae bacterium]